MKFLRNGHVVSGCVFKRFQRQRLPKLHVNVLSAPGVLDRRKNVAVPRRIGGDEDVLVVFGRCPNHGRAANVNHFEQLIVVERWCGRCCIAKRVEIAGHDTNGGIAQSSEFFGVAFLMQARQQWPVNRRVERFDTAVENFRVFGHF